MTMTRGVTNSKTTEYKHIADQTKIDHKTQNDDKNSNLSIGNTTSSASAGSSSATVMASKSMHAEQSNSMHPVDSSKLIELAMNVYNLQVYDKKNRLVEQDNDGNQIMHHAAARGGLRSLQFLLNDVAQPGKSIKNRNQLTPFLCAIKANQIAAVRLFMADFHINQQPLLSEGSELAKGLFLAASLGHNELLQLLTKDALLLFEKIGNSYLNESVVKWLKNTLEQGEYESTLLCLLWTIPTCSNYIAYYVSEYQVKWMLEAFDLAAQSQVTNPKYNSLIHYCKGLFCELRGFIYKAQIAYEVAIKQGFKPAEQKLAALRAINLQQPKYTIEQIIKEAATMTTAAPAVVAPFHEIKAAVTYPSAMFATTPAAGSAGALNVPGRAAGVVPSAAPPTTSPEALKNAYDQREWAKCLELLLKGVTHPEVIENLSLYPSEKQFLINNIHPFATSDKQRKNILDLLDAKDPRSNPIAQIFQPHTYLPVKISVVHEDFPDQLRKLLAPKPVDASAPVGPKLNR